MFDRGETTDSLSRALAREDLLLFPYLKGRVVLWLDDRASGDVEGSASPVLPVADDWHDSLGHYCPQVVEVEIPELVFQGFIPPGVEELLVRDEHCLVRLHPFTGCQAVVPFGAVVVFMLIAPVYLHWRQTALSYQVKEGSILEHPNEGSVPPPGVDMGGLLALEVKPDESGLLAKPEVALVPVRVQGLDGGISLEHRAEVHQVIGVLLLGDLGHIPHVPI